MRKKDNKYRPPTKYKKWGEDLSFHKLSKLSGVSICYISRLFSGRRSNPSMNVIKKLAKGMGVSEGAIISRIDKNVKKRKMKKWGGLNEAKP